MSKTTGHATDSRTRSLAEAMILQSIEDLWNPVCKKRSLIFFEGDGFMLCSEIAGISYIEQLAVLRMLACAGPKEVYATRERHFKRHALDAFAEVPIKEETPGRVDAEWINTRFEKKYHLAAHGENVNEFHSCPK
jgi:hypothetical protein